MARALVVFGLTLLSTGALQRAALQPEIAYVHASRASLRSGPSPDSRVIAQFTTNTEVRLERREGTVCLVASSGRRGFLPCNLLGSTQLTQAEAMRQASIDTQSATDRLEWGYRAFWINPSLSRWMDLGEVLRELVTNELVTGPQRPQQAEFDATKERLARGVTVASAPAGSNTFQFHYLDPVEAAKRIAQLPAARPSHFLPSETPFVIPLSPFHLGDLLYAAAGFVDALSNVHRTRTRIEVLTGPILDPRRGWYYGIWDAGTLGVTFDDNVLVHGVTANGRAVAVRIESLKIIAEDFRCPRSELGLRTTVVRGPWDRAIVGWVGRSPVATPTVKMRKFDGPKPTDKLVTEDIDLNADGTADLAVWSGYFRRMIADDGSEDYWKAVFVNVGGTWQLAAYDQLDECT